LLRPLHHTPPPQIYTLSLHDALPISVIKQHFGEYPLYGWFFAAVATGQLAWAILAVAGPSRALLLAGTAANALVVTTWVLTRTRSEERRVGKEGRCRGGRRTVM